MKKITILIMIMLGLLLVTGCSWGKTKGDRIGSDTAPTLPEVQNSTNNNNSSATITEAQAKEIVLAQVPGATESDIRGFGIDYDDGRLEYEGTIYFEEMKYEFEIDGYSGAIRNWDVESVFD